MKTSIFIGLIVILTSVSSFAQDAEVLDSIKSNFERNNYSKVIDFSNEYLLTGTNLNEDELTEIYLMRSVSYFALSKKDSAKFSFIELLKIDKNFDPDPAIVSPKIINFFKPIKSDFHKMTNHIKDEDTTIKNGEYNNLTLQNSYTSSSIMKNMVLPGWGHFNSGNTTKAILLTSVSSVLLGSSIYYTIKTNDLHNQYLSESDTDLIADKYNDYNASYKTRNILLASYAVVWIYSILDVWLFSSDEFINVEISQVGTSKFNPIGYNLQVKIMFNL